jgi:dUTP pyrophosphatase
MLTNPFPDSGFDVMSPNFITARNENVNKIDFLIRCSATIENADGSSQATGYYLYPRSSISKTPLRLANSTGIIDSGYRGNIMAMFDCLYQTSYKLDKFQRICQICAPTLIPIYVNVVPEESDLGIATSRGSGGFGSTGK